MIKKEYNIENYKNILHQVYKLACKKSLSNEVSNPFGTFDFDLEKIIRERTEDPLFLFLNDLDIDAIKVVQAVMYIGNSNDYANESKNEAVNKCIEDLPWGEKETEVNVIYDKKAILAEYLRSGFEKLGI
ncbi:MAG: DUF3775 domain-containing protein [Oscillospiraceae bacterium]|nr:DUF3775 domain-containing protein [Oscillospiraceae bacterium]